MSEALSPAAQAVLDTMSRSYDHEPTRCLLAAGVLRAAAVQLRSEEYETCGGSSYALMIEVDDLRALADELAAHAQATTETRG